MMESTPGSDPLAVNRSARPGDSQGGGAGSGREVTAPDPGQPDAPDELVVALQHSAARALADLLELLGEVPSTPPILAHVSAARAADVSRLLPLGGGLGGAPSRGTIDVTASSLASVAGLLQRFGELPSTPPVVADDARSWASRLWERLEQDPPAGHHPPA